MDLVLMAVKSDLDNVLQIGRYLLTGFFTVAVFINYLGILQNKNGWGDLLIRLVVGFIVLQNYVWIMDTAKDIVVGLDQSINSQQNYIDQYTAMSDNMQTQYENNTQTSFISGVTNLFGRFTLHNLIINLSFMFYAIISKVMEAIRYCLIAIMYKLGPVLLPLILFHSTSRIIQGWFTSYISVLAWPILWHIVLSIAVALSAQIGNSGQGIEEFACLNFAVCFVLIFTPLIMSNLVAGIGLGSVASLAGVILSRITLNSITQATRGGVKVLSAGVTKAAQATTVLKQTPTLSGHFRKVMVDRNQNNKNSSQSLKKTMDQKAGTL